MSKQLLFDYQNDKNSLKTDVPKLGSYISALSNQIREKYDEAEELRKKTILIHGSLIT
ncbi:virulence associated lipoprotein [Borreliella turdi]|uniref:virulence associated lipoprotein n=1 Tax=Borreliella turdi TaxID=57863 RepID=UPI001F20A7AD|nr:virulence associated lipoprotein [Borreliella turdi]